MNLDARIGVRLKDSFFTGSLVWFHPSFSQKRTRYERNKKPSLGFYWSDFHLCSFNGVICSLPCVPDHPLPGFRMFAVQINTI